MPTLWQNTTEQRTKSNLVIHLPMLFHFHKCIDYLKSKYVFKNTSVSTGRFFSEVRKAVRAICSVHHWTLEM